jgi:hypothetical protein
LDQLFEFLENENSNNEIKSLFLKATIKTGYFSNDREWKSEILGFIEMMKLIKKEYPNFHPYNVTEEELIQSSITNLEILKKKKNENFKKEKIETKSFEKEEPKKAKKIIYKYEINKEIISGELNKIKITTHEEGNEEKRINIGDGIIGKINNKTIYFINNKDGTYDSSFTISENSKLYIYDKSKLVDPFPIDLTVLDNKIDFNNIEINLSKSNINNGEKLEIELSFFNKSKNEIIKENLQNSMSLVSIPSNNKNMVDCDFIFIEQTKNKLKYQLFPKHNGLNKIFVNRNNESRYLCDFTVSESPPINVLLYGDDYPEGFMEYFNDRFKHNYNFKIEKEKEGAQKVSQWTDIIFYFQYSYFAPNFMEYSNSLKSIREYTSNLNF